MSAGRAPALAAIGVALALGCATPPPDAGAFVVPPSLVDAMVTPEMGSPHAGDPAPSFELPRVGGGRVRLADLRGKPVLVHFTATWCPYCREEIAAIAAIAREVGDRAAVILVDVMESEARWSELGALELGEVGAAGPMVLLDEDGAVSARYAPPRARPFLERAEVPLAGTVLIDASGVVRLYVLADNAQFDPTLSDLRAAFLTLVAAPASAVPHVELRALPLRVLPGEPAVLELHALVPPGLHVMSEAPPDPALIATTLALVGDGLDVGAPAWPAAMAYRVAERELPTFLGDVIIRVPVRARVDAAPGPRRLVASLRYQACTATRCFLPRTTTASVEVEVSARE